MTYPVIDWHGLYGEGWAEDIVPEAFSHPAKYSRALIRHIYQYLLDNGLIQRGARILDPFGGVALGALDAQLQGLHWTGCELEPKFVTLGNANLALWQSKYAPHFPRWGSARLIQGDSRRIGEVIAGVSGIVSSPPYQALDVKTDFSSNPNAEKYHINPDQPGNGPREYGTSPGQLGAMPSGDVQAILSSPPFTGVVGLDGGASKRPEDYGHIGDFGKEYGESDGQLGAMPSGDYGAVIASPPFGSHDSAGPESLHTRTDKSAQAMLSDQGWNGGGQVSENNLASMPEDDYDAVIASPPFIQTSGGTNVTSTDGPLSDASLIARHSAGNAAMEAYGAEDGQLQNMREGNVDAILSSPPYATDVIRRRDLGKEGFTQGATQGKHAFDEYGSETGQLQNMPEGDVDAIIASPPFIDNNVNIGAVGDTPAMRQQIHDSTKREKSYGETSGQLGNLPEGDVQAVVSSPPYEGIMNNPKDAQETADRLTRLGYDEKYIKAHVTNPASQFNADQKYGASDGQLGNDSGDSFWSASLQIVSQCYALLADGGIAVFVTKRYVRNKRIVEFSKQWEALCNKVGFETILWARAWVTEDNGTQLAFGDTPDKAHIKSRKSFFRRLAEAKGSPRIDWEDVIFLQKPKS